MQKYLHLFCGSFLHIFLTEGSQENVKLQRNTIRGENETNMMLMEEPESTLGMFLIISGLLLFSLLDN